jgi:hypothetical protein
VSARDRWSDLHAAQQRRLETAEDPETRHRHGLSERISDEIDLVAERGERPDAVKLAERGSARLEKRLGRDHQNAHGSGDFRMKP